MAVHPIEFRYSTPNMRAVFEEENILAKKLLVEAAIAKAHAAVGNIPKDVAGVISKNANVDVVKISRVKEIEKETQHDLMAIVKALSERCGDAGKYVHLGATSYDVVDTAWALILNDALDVLEKDLLGLKKILLEKTKKYRDLTMVGRTHGQHAVPITLGLKFAVWAAEVERHLYRVEESKKMISVGKMTGAVGTGAALGEKALEVQKEVMKELGLEVPLATTQVVQRDRHAEVVFHVVLLSQTLVKIAQEIRNLQRTEIGEVSEPFGKKQVGSSTMPQKRNPWKSERVCGIGRYLRGLVGPALGNVALEHERDLTNSSCERLLFPESFILTDFMLVELSKILDGLQVYPENIKKNLALSGGLEMAEAVMLKLTEKGMGRQEAHEAVRKAAMKSIESKKPFAEVLVADSGLGRGEIDAALNPENYLGAAKEQIDLILKKLS
jgi:adenylosuccinate lyase